MAVLHRVFALCNSGRGAVVEWLLDQYHRNDYATTRVRNTDVSYVQQLGLHLPNDLPRSAEKSVLVVEHVNAFLPTVPEIPPAVLRVWSCLDLIILRDPYNWLASRLKSNATCFLAEYMLYAKAFRPEHARPRTSYIRYNRWLTDPEYRHELLLTMHLQRQPEETLAGMSDSGSAFDQGEAAPPAEALLGRWKQMAHDPRFMQRATDPRVPGIARELFQLEPNWNEAQPQTM
jgi:hypothetical protein